MDLARHEKKFEKNKKRFRRFIKEMDESSLTDVVPIAQEAEREVWEQIDCLTCANCCKTMTPTLTKADRLRISEHLNISKKEFEEKYLAHDKKSKDWQMAKQPCVFLDQQTNKCTIYEIRPTDCREFPHLVKQPLEDYVYIHKQNIRYCPATYLWVEKMYDRIEFSKK